MISKGMPMMLRNRCAAAAFVMLLVSVIVASTLNTRKHAAERFLISEPTKNTGSCIIKPIHTSTKASHNEKASACAASCNSNASINYFTVSQGYTPGGVGNGALVCKCCDPGTTVSMVSQNVDSDTCMQGVSYGVSPDARSMYTKNGCNGVFKWGDGVVFPCNSSDNGGHLTTCPYFMSETDITSLAGRKDRAAMAADAIARSKQREEDKRLTKLAQDTALILNGLPTIVMR